MRLTENDHCVIHAGAVGGRLRWKEEDHDDERHPSHWGRGNIFALKEGNGGSMVEAFWVSLKLSLTHFPNEKGPRLSSLCPRNLAAMGTEYAKYWPVTTREKTASIAVGPANAKRPNIEEMMATNQTAKIGAWVRLLTLYRNLDNGRAPSRENAKACREAVVN